MRSADQIPEQPIRLVRHVLPDGTAHIDLFICTPGLDMLPTFEISDALQAPLTAALRHGIRLRVCDPAEAHGHAARKADHRPRYRDYTGMIGENRGEIIELGRGVLRGIINGDFYFQIDLPGKKIFFNGLLTESAGEITDFYE